MSSNYYLQSWSPHCWWTVNDVIVTVHCVSCRVGSLQLFGSSDGTFENISTKFTHIDYHRNDSTSLCTIHSIYILVLEDVIGSDVVGRFLLSHPVHDYAHFVLLDNVLCPSSGISGYAHGFRSRVYQNINCVHICCESQHVLCGSSRNPQSRLKKAQMSKKHSYRWINVNANKFSFSFCKNGLAKFVSVTNNSTPRRLHDCVETWYVGAL